MGSYLMETDLAAHSGVRPPALIYTNTKGLDALLTGGAPLRHTPHTLTHARRHATAALNSDKQTEKKLHISFYWRRLDEANMDPTRSFHAVTSLTGSMLFVCEVKLQLGTDKSHVNSAVLLLFY